MLDLVLCLSLLSDPVGPPELAVYGLELPVADVAAAARAYVEGLGFRAQDGSGECARLERDGLVLVLVRSEAPLPAPDSAGVVLNLEAGDLERARARALAAGFRALTPEPRALSIGRALALVDPDGHSTHLIQLARGSGLAADGLALFNLGLELESESEWPFATALGFEILTRAYLPDALPIRQQGACELVLHAGARAPRLAGTRSGALLLAAADLDSALEPLTQAGFLEAGAEPRATPLGRRLALRVPSGVRVDLIERSPAQLAFERLCALAGSWEGRSSAGWNARAEIEVIARGSVVCERTNFEAHPGETMLTLFHRDGKALVLTHYCVAGNQPRLVASEIADGRLHFTFRDATNLSTRDQGHMDEVVLQLSGPDSFSARWSFYQAGSTGWMEEIQYRRKGALEARETPR